MKTIYTLAIALMSGVILTACGASGAINNLNNSLNNSLNMGNSDDDDSDNKVSGDAPEPTSTIADRIISFNLLGTFSTNNTETTNDDIIRATVSESDDTFALATRGDNFIMTVNGTEHVIDGTPSSFNSDLIWYNVNSNVNIFVATRNSGGRLIIDNLKLILAGTHPTIEGTFVKYATDTNDYTDGGSRYDLNYTGGHATIGIQTSADVVANQSAIATYNGRMAFELGLSEITASLGGTVYFSDISMEVDFDANTVAGTATFPLMNSQNQGTANFASAPIVGNGFAGAFAFDEAFYRETGITDNPTGQYAGHFFGADAEDLAGVIQINGVSANGSIIGFGGFRADRQDSQ